MRYIFTSNQNQNQPRGASQLQTSDYNKGMQQELGNFRNFYFPAKNDQYPRIGHRIISHLNQILIFGGINSLGQYNTATMKLDCQTMSIETIQTQNMIKLQGFSLFSYNNRIYLWGGSAPFNQSQKMSICKNKLYMFTGNYYEVVEQGGTIPAPREYHSSCFFRNRFLIIMGGNNDTMFFNDWHILDCSSMTWTKITLTMQPPPILNTLMFWNSGRGFLVAGEIYNPLTKQVIPNNKIYSFRFKNFQNKTIQIQELTVSCNFKQKTPRGSPVGVLTQLQSPYIILVGGEVKSDRGVFGFCKTIDYFNLQTLEWHSYNLVSHSACSFEAVYINEKIYLVGGITNNRSINQAVEFIELKIDNVEAKLCKICREIYGVREMLPNDKNMNIKFQPSLTSKVFFDSQIIAKMASYINYPLSSFGLLIDNSLNFSATQIQISFDQEGEPSKEQPIVKSFINIQKIKNYSYIKISDNSFGFTQNQILECLSSFSVKTQKLTGDKRFEQDLQIRKQYGINLKLGVLRLGKSCLFITKTQQGSKIFAYFSCSPQLATREFSIISYVVTSDKTCSSQINRRIIHQAVRQKIPNNYEDIETITSVFIFDFDVKELLLISEGQKQVEVCHQQSSNKIYRYLTQYLQSLYLVPYIGRTITLNQTQIKFKNYIELLRKDETKGNIVKLTDNYPTDFFSLFNIFKITCTDYQLQCILIYHKNRLIFTMNGFENRFCGIIQLADRVKIDLCKTKIQNRTEEIYFLKIVKSIIQKHDLKRISEPVFSVDNPIKPKEPNIQSTVKISITNNQNSLGKAATEKRGQLKEGIPKK